MKTLWLNKRQWKMIWMVVLPILFVVMACIPSVRDWFVQVLQLFAKVDPQEVAQFIRSYGSLAVVISFLLMVMQSVAAPLPAFLITFANAAVFGWVWGAVLSWTSAMVGAALCFGIARFYGHETVVKLAGKTSLKWIDNFFTTSGAYAILIARLLPFMPFDIVSYAAGLTSMRTRTFLIATGIGQLPATIIYSYAGEMLVGGARNFVFALLIIFSLLVLTVGLRQWITAKRNKTS